MLGAKVSQVLCTKIIEMDAVEKWFGFWPMCLKVAFLSLTS